MPKETLKNRDVRREDCRRVKLHMEKSQTSRFPVDGKPSKDPGVDMRFDKGLLERESHEIYNRLQVKVLPVGQDEDEDV